MKSCEAMNPKGQRSFDDSIGNWLALSRNVRFKTWLTITGNRLVVEPISETSATIPPNQAIVVPGALNTSPSVKNAATLDGASASLRAGRTSKCKADLHALTPLCACLN